MLDLYHVGDQQRSQYEQTYQLALKRLADMERQRDELNETIGELKSQLKWGEQLLAQFDTVKAAE